MSSTQSSLTTAQLADVLGFETAGGWKSSSAALGLSANHSQGKSSLSVSTTGWNEIISVPLTSLGVGAVHTLSFDVRPPSPPASPWWFGEAQLLVDAPSQGLWTRYLGRYDLAQAKGGAFNTATFQIPDDVAAKLAAQYSDLTFHIVLNTPSGSQPYLLDNLRLNGKSLQVSAGLQDCPAFVRTLSSGDLRYELVTSTRRSVVELVLRKNGTDTTRNITTSERQLARGTYSYVLTDAKTSFNAGDSVAVRFRSRAVGSSVDVFSPGPDASKFSDALAYDAARSCKPIEDSDGDGKLDLLDHCPSDPAKSEPGFCGCNQAETDSDGDKTPDCKDRCPSDPNKTIPGDCGCAGAYAPAGTACSDGPCPGKFTCNGSGQCGSALACAIPGTVGLPKDYRLDDQIYLLVPNNQATWSEVGRLAPAGYSRLEPNSAQENAALAAQILKYYGPNACVWTSATVTAPGVIESVPRSGQPGTRIWDEQALPHNVGGSFSSFAASPPPPGVSTGCVAMYGDGSWRVQSCSNSCFMVYERSSRSLLAKANPADFRVSCSDFPGVVCNPLDGYDKAAEALCVPEGSALPARKEDVGDAGVACNACQATAGADCSQVCTGAAAAPGGERSCQQDLAPQVCRVTPNAALSKTCTTSADCSVSGQICGVYSYTLNVGDSPAAKPWQQPECKASTDGSPSRCTTVRICGTPTDSCDTNLPTPAGEPACQGADCPCGELKVCTVPMPVGESNPLAAGQGSNLGATEFNPAAAFKTIPEPAPQPIRDEPPTLDKRGDHSWCQFAPAVPDSQVAGDGKDGHAGSGSALKLDFDPNLDLKYDLTPLAQGDLDFELRASASFSAKAEFSMKNVQATVDIVDAQIGAVAKRCQFATLAKLDVFGLDFLPLVEAKLGVGPLSRSIPQDPARCEQAVAAFQEVANRAKKAMRDAQELLKQYHDGLKGNQCLKPDALCHQLMDKAPAGFPKLSCTGSFTAEDAINTFIWNYERQFDAELPMPESLKGRNLSFDMLNPSAPDPRLPNPSFPTSIPKIPSLPELSVPSLPDLEHAQEALASRAGNNSSHFIGAGCTSDKIQTERRTLLTVNFQLGPIPMLLEVEGVLKYGIDYGVDLDFDATNLLTSSKSRATVASVKAFAEPCAGAGVALFVGAGFSYGSFKVAAGVEGMVNLVTLSMPAHAGASVQAAREQVKLIDPQVQKFVAAASDDVDAPRSARFVARELAGLWDGTTFPLYRQHIYLGYDYGARIVAADMLTGKLSATATAKFWRFKKKWRTTLVNFGSEGHTYEQSLLHGHDELDIASGPFPWLTLDMPDAFVHFRPLNFTPQEFVGWKFGDLIAALRSKGGSDFSMPALKLPDLSRLGFELGDLTAIRLPDADLRLIAPLLNLSFEDLKLRLQNAGSNMADLRLSDLAGLHFGLIDLADWPVSDAYLSALDLDLSGMIKLGFDLSKLSLPKLGLSQKSDHAQCSKALDLTRVGDFIYDNFCAKPEPTSFDEIRSLPDVITSPNQLGYFEQRIDQKFSGYVDPATLTVTLQPTGIFDDSGYVIDSVFSAPLVSTMPDCSVAQSGKAKLSDLTPYVNTFYDRIKNQTTISFSFRAQDACGLNVGWTGIKVRYTAGTAS